ncbi:4Fe-4S dicluster domain-containing protein [Streptomyces odontomachi]|uniref:4Fe-4S dicluster domain-containing protein n=1 Tax=Streptomyces odontomachi TaxID=2944940 RepID=UPI00210A2399|nr:4Fe-4S binding protein [Streptomyces sp. ODS25]
MSYVITEPCVDSKDSSCYDVCPVDAIQPTPDGPDFDKHDQLFIDPVACIDCGACEAVCPVEAIYDEDDVPEQWRSSIAANRQFFADEEAAT